MNVNRLYRLTCGVRYHDWGDRGAPGRLPLIAALGGLPADGRAFAELWMGALPPLAAGVPDWPGSPTLDVLIRQQPQTFLGPALAGAGVDALPFLLKILSCAQPLSIQAHPDRAHALELHAHDPANYPDANHKPEIAVALTPFVALAGFRHAAAVQADLQRVPALTRFFAGLANGPEWLRQAYGRVFTADATAATAALRDTALHLDAARVRTGHEDLFLRCAALFPGDRGALSIPFLNLMNLQPGEAIYLAANEPHAYVEGTIVECMAASDNVVRAGLTHKFVDEQVLLRLLTYRPGLPPLLHGTPTAPGVRRYRVPTPEFELEFRDMHAPAVVPADSCLSLLLILEGDVQLATPEWEWTAPRGSVLLWPASVPAVRATPRSATARWVRALAGSGTAVGSDGSRP